MKKALIVLVAIFCVVGMAQAQVSNSSSPGAGTTDSTCTGTDGSGDLSDTIAFTEVGTISDVDVAVEIDHTFRSDLQFHVNYSVGAAGNITLAADHDSLDDSYYATFDDEAGTLCSDATMCGGDDGFCDSAPNAVTCMPDVALTAFDGLTSPGTWTMELCDDAGGDSGTWQTWTMTLDGDGELPVELMGFSVD